MTIPFDAYMKGYPDSGRFYTFSGGGVDNVDPPFVGVVSNTFIIGPLTVCVRPNGSLTNIDLAKATAIPDFVRPELYDNARKQFEQEAGHMRSGQYLALHNLRSYNFWHWMMESLPKLILSKAAGFNGDIIIPPDLVSTRFVIESLVLLGEDPQRLLPYDGTPWWVEELYIPKPICGVLGLLKYPGLIQRLRDLFLPKVGSAPSTVHRLYISRNKSHFERKVVNEEALWQLLQRYDFQRVEMEKLSLREQIQLASGADVIVGPHGAGMTHALFMKPESLIIELFAPTYINPCLMPIADHLGHRYHTIPSMGMNYPHGNDIMANLPFIELTLKRELKRAA